MKNIVINLERRLDRKENIQKLFSHLEYEFYKAVDGKKLIADTEIFQLFKGNDFRWRKGILGCTLSHYNLWNSLITDKYDSYCIFEDDISVSENFSQEYLDKCKDFVNLNEIDILFLGYSMMKNVRQKFDHIYNREDTEVSFHPYNKNLYIGGFFGYIISKKGANKMLKYIRENGIKHGIDYLIKLNSDLKVYECQPFIVKSDWSDNLKSEVDSDIQKDYDYLKLGKEFYEILEINGNKYKFYRGLDSVGNDIHRIRSRNVSQIEQLARREEKCVCFNTLGYLKEEFSELSVSLWLHPVNDGLYVKIPSKKENVIQVKMLCNWCSSTQLCKEWNHMSQGNFTWNNIHITDSDLADYFVIINKPLKDTDFYIPEKTIIFHMEPFCYAEEQKWGVKTWGKWAKPEGFLQVRSHDKYINNALWQLNMTYTELKREKIKKMENNFISTICSSKYFDPGHIKRIDFLKFIEEKNDTQVQIHIYNWDNNHQFKNYKGSHPPGYKDAGIKPYKYYFMAENNSEKNFLTEKM